MIHADLVGLEFDTEKGRVRVVGDAFPNEQYVLVEYLDTGKRTVRLASLVRANPYIGKDL